MKVKFAYTFIVRGETFTSQFSWPNANLEELHKAIGDAIKLNAIDFELEVENES